MSDVNWDDSTVLEAGDKLLPDGREFHYEAWCESGYTFLTYLFPMNGLEEYSKEMLVSYLESQGIKIDLNKFPLDKIQLTKDSEKYNLTITCGEDDE